MGLLQKFGLLEEVPTPRASEEVELDIYDNETFEVANTEIESVNVDTLIDDIYAQNDLYDKSCSIFKVEELVASLPKEMATDTKRTSVMSILGSFGLTVTGVCEDGEQRVRVLDNIKQQINTECSDNIKTKLEQIEGLKKSIEALEVEISEEKNKLEVSNDIILDEIAKVETLVKFIGGVN